MASWDAAAGAAWFLGCRLKRPRRPWAVAGSDGGRFGRPVAHSDLPGGRFGLPRGRFVVADSGLFGGRFGPVWWPIRAFLVADSGRTPLGMPMFFSLDHVATPMPTCNERLHETCVDPVSALQCCLWYMVLESTLQMYLQMCLILRIVLRVILTAIAIPLILHLANAPGFWRIATMRRSSQHSASQRAADWTFCLGVDKTWGGNDFGEFVETHPTGPRMH